MLKNLKVLEDQLGLHFQSQELINQALVHRSYLNENRKFAVGNNERLEFLGDAVLELVVTEYLYKHYTNPEGDLTNWRASLVNSHMLAKLARELNIEDFLYLSKGESKDKNTKARDQILANCFEAITGAIYLEFGYQAAAKFIMERLLVKLDHILKNKLFLDPKTRFQESAQDKIGVTPHYKLIKEYGPDHDKHFVVGLYLNEEKISEGQGSSKQEAQIDAAAEGLKEKKW